MSVSQIGNLEASIKGYVKTGDVSARDVALAVLAVVQEQIEAAQKPQVSTSNSSGGLSGERWELARNEFTQMAGKQGWDLSEHPLHALYLSGDTQMYWEIFRAGFTAAI